jgi:hypothetical protein
MVMIIRWCLFEKCVRYVAIIFDLLSREDDLCRSGTQSIICERKNDGYRAPPPSMTMIDGGKIICLEHIIYIPPPPPPITSSAINSRYHTVVLS